MSGIKGWTPPPFDAAKIAGIEVRMGLKSSARCLELYYANAADLRKMRTKALASKNGKCGGFTADELTAMADLHEQRGRLVAAEVAKLLGKTK